MKAFVLLFLCLSGTLLFEVKGREDNIFQKGDIILGAMFPLHQQCGGRSGASKVDLGGLELAEAMLMTIDEINQNDTLLNNTSLGASIEDSCSSERQAMLKSLEFTEIYNQYVSHKAGRRGEVFDKSDAKGVIIVDSPNIVKPVTEILSKFNLIQIATMEQTSIGKNLHPSTVNIEVPVTAPAVILGKVVKQLNITEISAIISKTQEDNNALDAFTTSSGSSVKVKLNQTIPIGAKDRDFENIVENAVRVSTSHILLLTESEHEAREILKATMRLHSDNQKINASTFTWLASDGWGSNLGIVSGRDEVALGVISVERTSPEKEISIDSSKKSCWDFRNKQTQSCWHRQYLKNPSASCKRHGDDQQIKQFQNPRIHYVVESVYAFARALDQCYRENSENCDVAPEEFVSKYLRKEISQTSKDSYNIWKYRINDEGEFGYESLLSNNTKCDTASHCEIDTTINEGACPDDQVWTRPSRYESNCGRKCKRCPNFYTKSDYQTCKQIRKNYNDKNQERDAKYHLDHEPWTGFVYFLWALSFLGLAYVLIIFLIFFINRKTPVVRLSHGWRPLMLGFAILFMDTFVELEKPSELVCTFRRFVLAIGLTTVYGVLFVRGFSKYRILHALLEERKSHMAQVKIQRLIFALLISVQLLISVVWCMIKPPDTVREFAPQSNDDGELKCNTDEIARFFSQAFNFILITVTTFFAIRTRNIPCAFGEAKYMFWAMLSNWVVGLAFTITHYTNLDNYAIGRASLSLTTIISTYLVMLLMSIHKLYILLIRTDLNVMCDDMETLEHSVYDESLSNGNGAQKDVPKIEVETIEEEPDLIEKAESKENVQTEKEQSEMKQPKEKLLNEEDSTDVIVHSPE